MRKRWRISAIALWLEVAEEDTARELAAEGAHFTREPVTVQRDAEAPWHQPARRIARQSGHIVMTNGKTRLVIPRHNPINAMTMGSIAKDAGLTPDQFRELL